MKLIKIPATNGLGKTEGTELAPDKIIEKLKEFSLNESGQKPQFSIETVEIVKGNAEETNQNIIEHLSQIDDKPIILGGDHSITYACFKAFAKKFQNPGLLIFDAHPDMVNNFNPPTHEDFVRTLVEEKTLKPQNLILIGLRNWDQTEYTFLKQLKIKYYPMKEISFEGKQEVCDAVMAAARQFGALYISIDIDAVDPAFAPATGYIEPGGLTSRELLYFLHRLKNLKNIQAYDLVEINPKKDPQGLTVKLGSKIVGELFS